MQQLTDNSVCSYSAEAYFNIGIFIILLLNIVNEFSELNWDMDVSRENILKKIQLSWEGHLTVVLSSS